MGVKNKNKDAKKTSVKEFSYLITSVNLTMFVLSIKGTLHLIPAVDNSCGLLHLIVYNIRPALATLQLCSPDLHTELKFFVSNSTACDRNKVSEKTYKGERGRERGNGNASQNVLAKK